MNAAESDDGCAPRKMWRVRFRHHSESVAHLFEMERSMTYIVNDNCIKCKYTDCVEVCPVDCFYEGENMLIIHPDECIDCGVCEPECPVDAIKPDTEPDLDTWGNSTPNSRSTRLLSSF